MVSIRDVEPDKVTMTNTLERCTMLRDTLEPHVCPVTKIKDKECLATYTKINGVEAWTLWDSSCTTVGITLAFATIAKVPTFPLLDPHIIQLGMVGSHAMISLGAEVSVETCNVKDTLYVDIANFDCYDMIIGIPFMRKYKVILDIGNSTVSVAGQKIPALKVPNPNLDPQVQCHRISDKKKY